MRILLFLTLSFIISNRSNGQLNIDSLYGTMKNTIPTENIEISGFKKLTFYNELENTSYQFTVDKKGTISNNDWGSCLLITKMDSIGRPIEKRTFEKGGKLFGAKLMDYSSSLKSKCYLIGRIRTLILSFDIIKDSGIY